MIGKIFMTRSGYDPQLGKHVKDPYLGPCPTLGACRPDIRRQLNKGDHIFVISGKVPEVNQFVMAGFEIESKIHAIEAYRLFPELRLRRLHDGQLTGNIIVAADGRQHELDDHNSFNQRIQNYVVGTNLIFALNAGRNRPGKKANTRCAPRHTSQERELALRSCRAFWHPADRRAGVAVTNMAGGAEKGCEKLGVKWS